MLDGGHVCRSIVGSQAYQVAAAGLVCGLHRRLIVPPRPVDLIDLDLQEIFGRQILAGTNVKRIA